MKTEWVLSQEAFDSCLAWLDADRDRAGEKYEQIRRELIKDFVHRECFGPETQADEVIDRVIRELPDIVGTYSGDQALYVYAVAEKLLLRFWKWGPDTKMSPAVNEPKRQIGEKDAWRRPWHLGAEMRELSLNRPQQERLQ